MADSRATYYVYMDKWMTLAMLSEHNKNYSKAIPKDASDGKVGKGGKVAKAKNTETKKVKVVETVAKKGGTKKKPAKVVAEKEGKVEKNGKVEKVEKVGKKVRSSKVVVIIPKKNPANRVKEKLGKSKQTMSSSDDEG